MPTNYVEETVFPMGTIGPYFESFNDGVPIDFQVGDTVSGNVGVPYISAPDSQDQIVFNVQAGVAYVFEVTVQKSGSDVWIAVGDDSVQIPFTEPEGEYTFTLGLPYDANGTSQLSISAGSSVTYTFTVLQVIYPDPSEGDDYIVGNMTSDRVDLLGGNDTYNGGDGNDSVRGGEGNDTLFGGNGNDALFGGAGNDLFGGIGGNDTLFGGAGDDFYVINSKDDSVIELADEGTDRIQTTIDLTLVDNVEELALIEGTEGTIGVGNSLDNRLFGNSNDNLLSGLDGDDVLFGRAGDDTLLGGDGVDLLFGGDGNDVLKGGAGNDVLFGGTGSDTFTFNDEEGVDAIRDFGSTTDIIDLSGVFATLGYMGEDPIEDAYLYFGVKDNNTFVQVDADGTGGNSQFVNIAVIRNFSDTGSLQIGGNVIV